MPYIQLKDVSFTHQLAEHESIMSVNLDIEPGKIYGLIGANGSGKTTLLNILRGFVPRYFPGNLSGSIQLDGQNLAKYTSSQLARKVGYIFQNPFTQISGAKDTVFEEVAYGLENLGYDRSDIIQRVKTALKDTKTAPYAFRSPYALSGGQQQRVAFASVLVMDQECLLIDEPTSQLDPKSSDSIFSIIRSLKEKGKTIILVEQKMDALIELADEMIVMAHGRISQTGHPREIFASDNLQQLAVEWPEIVKLRENCLKLGYPLAKDTLNATDIIKAIQATGKVTIHDQN